MRRSVVPTGAASLVLSLTVLAVGLGLANRSNGQGAGAATQDVPDLLEQLKQRREVTEQAATVQALDGKLRALLLLPVAPLRAFRVQKETRDAVLNNTDIGDQCRTRLLCWVDWPLCF